MTNRTVTRLNDLLLRADELLELANRVQLDGTPEPASVLQRLEGAYGMWFAEALSVLPAEVEKPFREEFDGGFLSYKIKSFLQSGLEPQVMFQELVEKGMSKWLHPAATAFRGPLLQQKQILRNVIAQQAGPAGVRSALDMLEDDFRNLPQALAVLRSEVQGRPGLEVADEYDLQRIVHAFLCLRYRDVRPEEYGPSRAGARPRIDFLLKHERVAVETKMTRRGLGPRQLGDELAADVLRYEAHPHADGYFALVYDPGHHIVNSHGFETDFPIQAQFPSRVVIVR